MYKKLLTGILSFLIVISMVFAGCLFVGVSDIVRAEETEDDEYDDDDDWDDWDDEDWELDIVMNFKATKIAKNSVTLTWDKVEDIDGYELSYKKASASSWTTEKIAATRTKHVVKGLKVGTKYNFRIRIYLDYTLDDEDADEDLDEGEEYDFIYEEDADEDWDDEDEDWADIEYGEFSKMNLTTLSKSNEGSTTAVSTTYEEPAPKSVKAIRIKVLKSKKKKKAFIKVSKSKNANGYRIYISKYKKKRFRLCKTLKKPSKVKCTINKLKSGKRYYFKVCAYIKSGEKFKYTKYSKVKSVKIK